MDNNKDKPDPSDKEDKPEKPKAPETPENIDKDDIGNFTNHELVKRVLPAWYKNTEPNQFIRSSSEIIGGTISSLEALDLIVKRFQDDTKVKSKSDIDKQVSEFVEPIKEELQVVRTQIQNTTNVLGSMKGFIDENKEALTTLISVNGKMGGLEGQIASLVGRVAELEADKKEKDQNKLNVFLIITTITSICIALASCAFGAVAIYNR